MTETLTVIVLEDPAAEDAVDIATIHAETFPHEILDGPLHNVSCDTIVPYESEKADELLDTALAETRQSVRTNLEIIYEMMSDTDPSGFADLIDNTKFRNHCLRASSVELNEFELYDGTGYHYGTPITTQDTVDEIISNTDEDAYVAQVSFER